MHTCSGESKKCVVLNHRGQPRNLASTIQTNAISINIRMMQFPIVYKNKMGLCLFLLLMSGTYLEDD